MRAGGAAPGPGPLCLCASSGSHGEAVLRLRLPCAGEGCTDPAPSLRPLRAALSPGVQQAHRHECTGSTKGDLSAPGLD
ncbi:hypothetical protein NDU88_008714 [Pleurodeles waltl]|uniref:Uncharacterized protein n=1 Tax=Pleurodeles waltl TaxID=8319 RepID=A0AAV7RXP0_PLEWA|nr:hypothetical protein NDU88_008714 [Pleurodeles waltl]